MKSMSSCKPILIALLTALVLAGCATAPKPVEPTGPSAEVTQAIDAANAAIAQADSLGASWRDTADLVKSAQDAAAGGDNEVAMKLANQARGQAELAINQYYLENAKVLYDEASSVQGMSAAQQNTLAAAGDAIRNAEGRKAYDLLAPLVAELRAASMQYQVVRGDSLWSISGQADVYNNPYQWPLIYKANRDQISDADLIHPGQIFSVDRNPSAADVNAAVNHARNRGAWSVGVVEASDSAYLGGRLELQ